ncbi:MAG: dihydropteroate synthase [Eubacteriales bacterium]|nr:dihydropteroate synthase [Eubacteriales bacterium]
MQIGTKNFDFRGQYVYIMGILNVTPDSFSDGGRYNDTDRALRHVEEMIAQGADIIDIGGESTRPGYQKITVEEEIQRVTSVIRLVKERFDIPVSIDTYKAPVMDAALDAGADLANDIWGLQYDALYAPEGQDSVWPCGTLAQVVARHQKPVCIMHNRPEPVYENFLEEMVQDLTHSLTIAENAGIAKDQVILDPGIGFGKTYEMNLEVLANLDRLQSFDLPLLLAASRKSVIGLTLDLPVEQREEGTLVTSVLASLYGWDMVRVHDVEKNVRAIQMMEKIKEFRENP